MAGSLDTNNIAFWKLGEASGTRSDSVGSNDLTDNNTVTQAVGKVGSAGQFTAANSEYLSIADNTDLSTGNIDFAWAGWVYMDTKPGNDMPIASKFTGTGDQREWILQWKTTADRFRFTISSAGTGGTNVAVTANNLGAPNTATWYFIVAWHDATANTINIQVNNGTIDSQAHSLGGFDGTGDFTIGADSEANNFWNGRIDAAGFWKKALSASEKSILYASGVGLEHPWPASPAEEAIFRSLHTAVRRDFRKLSRSRVFFRPDFLGPPAAFRVESRTTTTAHLTWDNSAAPFTSFIEVERALGDGSFSFVVRVAFSQGEFTDTGLAAGTRYRYRIRVV